MLFYLVDFINKYNVIAGDPSTYVNYGKVHDDLKLPTMGNTVGRSLERQGLDDLANWLKENGYPAITGLIVSLDSREPSRGYFRAYGRKHEDFVWWNDEIKKSLEYNWAELLSHYETNEI